MKSLNVIVNELKIIRKHRTLVVIFTDKNITSEFIERSNRFVESLNKSDTIKADIYLMSDGCLFELGNKPPVYPIGKIGGGRSLVEIKQLAQSLGYSQYCVLDGTGI